MFDTFLKITDFKKNTSKTGIGVHLAMGMDSMSCSVCTERKQFGDFQKPINGSDMVKTTGSLTDVLLEVMRSVKLGS